MPRSENPTINFCDAMVRKANLLNDKFRGNRQPEYMRKGQAHSPNTKSLDATGQRPGSSKRWTVMGGEYSKDQPSSLMGDSMPKRGHTSFGLRGRKA